jgi:hypothetical protein
VSVLDRSLFTPLGNVASNDPDHMRRFDYTSIPATTDDVLPVSISDPTVPQDDPQVEEIGLGPDDFMIDGTIFTVGADFEERVKSREIDGVTLYPIINAPGAEFGSNVERILREFTQEDVPFGLGTFDDRGTFYRPEDVGSAVQDTGLDLLNILETPVRGLAGFFGEFVGGPKGKKEFQSYIPEAPSDLDRGLNKASYIAEITDFTDPISEIEKDDENITPTETVTEKTPEELEAEQQMTIDKGLQEIYELSKGTVADPQAGLEEDPDEGKDDVGISDEDEGESKQQKALNLFQFDDPKVNRFLRNVGSALVKEGQFTGLGTGAAAFAEEEAQRDLLAEQNQQEINKILFEKGLEGQGNLEPKDLKTLRDFGKEVSVAARDFQGGQSAIGFMDIIIQEIENAPPGKIGGLGGFVDSIGAKLAALFGNDIPFNKLGAQAKIEALAKVVQQGNLQAILGESGRTISDKDRAIVVEVFGTPGLFDNRNTSLKLLRASRKKLTDNNIQRKEDMETSYALINDPAFGRQGQDLYTRLAPSVSAVRTIDPTAASTKQTLDELIANTIVLRPGD